MLRAFRLLYAVTAWAFLIGLVAQVFLIGLALFSDPAAIDAHRSLGWVLHLSPLLVLLFAFLSRAGSRHWQWALALAVVVLIVPILATMRESAPIVGALHPVGAVLAAILAAVVAWNSVAAARMGSDAAHAPA
jgi:hypothetical protein